MRKSQIIVLLASLCLAMLLPIIGHKVRSSGPSGCAFDGQKVDAAYKVRIQDGDGGNYEFCCIRCAELWLGRRGAAAHEIHVTDEPSGEEIPASVAFFVRSRVITMKTTLNRVHVFKNKPAAESHA